MKKIVALFTLLAVLTACGGGGRPSQDEIADALKGSDDFAAFTEGVENVDEVIDCMAGVLHDSDLSDDALQALVDGDDDFDGSKDDTETLAGLGEEFAACVTG